MASSDSTSKRSRRVPQTEYERLATSKGMVFVGPYTGNVRDKVMWRCKFGHEWDAPYYSIRSGCGCPRCGLEAVAEKLKTPASRYAEAAQRWGIEWVDTIPPGVDTKTRWRCSEGHVFEATLTNVRKGALCPICGRKRQAAKRRYGPDRYHALARERGLIWHGESVVNTGVPTGWECGCGCIWQASYDNIAQGFLCPECGKVRTANKRRIAEEQYHRLARSRGFQWLGPYTGRVAQVTTWQDEHGHQWSACYNSIQNGTGCPYCLDYVDGAKVSGVQRSLCDLVGGTLNVRVGAYWVDVAFTWNQIPVACEYDSYYWHRVVTDLTEHEARRDRELAQLGWRVLRVRSNLMLPQIDQISEACTRFLCGEMYAAIILPDWGTC